MRDDIDGYAVTLDHETGDGEPITEDDMDGLLDQLAAHGGCISARTTSGWWSTTVSVDAAPSPVAALERAVLEVGRAADAVGIPSCTVVAAEVLTYAEQDRRLAEPSK